MSLLLKSPLAGTDGALVVHLPILPAGLITPTQDPPLSRREVAAWKAFFLALVMAFSLVAFPWNGARESGISAASLLSLVNQDRSQNGVMALSINPKLQAAAETKARDMLREGYFSHDSPSGLKPWDFIKKAGFTYSYAGENLAMNYTSPYELEKDFLNSPGHRENLLSPNFSETGIAVLAGELNGQPAIVTVQMFARQ